MKHISNYFDTNFIFNYKNKIRILKKDKFLKNYAFKKLDHSLFEDNHQIANQCEIYESVGVRLSHSLINKIKTWRKN